MYHQVERSEILRSACRVHLYIPRFSENTIISVYIEKRREEKRLVCVCVWGGGALRVTCIEG